MNEAVPMELVDVRVELPSSQPVVLLRERDGKRYLPIYIGTVEASAIAFALEGMVPPRPMTHDLLRDVSEALGGEVNRVVVTELKDNVFFAELVIDRSGEEVHISSRPSDAIAVAVRTGANLYAHPSVLEHAGVELEEDDDEAEIEKFRTFLEHVDPGDFEGHPSG